MPEPSKILAGGNHPNRRPRRWIVKLATDRTTDDLKISFRAGLAQDASATRMSLAETGERIAGPCDLYGRTTLRRSRR